VSTRITRRSTQLAADVAFDSASVCCVDLQARSDEREAVAYLCENCIRVLRHHARAFADGRAHDVRDGHAALLEQAHATASGADRRMKVGTRGDGSQQVAVSERHFLRVPVHAANTLSQPSGTHTCVARTEAMHNTIRRVESFPESFPTLINNSRCYF
jgi:hypothetical protein